VARALLSDRYHVTGHLDTLMAVLDGVCAPGRRVGPLVVFGLGCLPWRGLLGQKQGEGGGECQDLRRDVQRDRQRGRPVAESGQAQAAHTPSISAKEKNVALVSRTIGDSRSSSVVISTRSRGT
jgi:hypothetical protein